MSNITNPHDKFFKHIMSRPEHAAEFLQNMLPEKVVRLLELDNLVMVKDSFVEKELREYFSDLLYEVRIKGKPGYIYLLFEHKSSPDALAAFQVLKYMVRIWEQRLRKPGVSERPFPIILPLIFYHGVHPWNAAASFHGLFSGLDPALEEYVPDFRYLLCDLSSMDDDAIKGQVTLRASMLLLKYIQRSDLKEKLPGILELLYNLGTSKTGLEHLELLLRYLVNGTDTISGSDLRHAIAKIPQGEKLMPTIAEQWVQEGIQQGILQGKQEGLQEGIQKGIQRGRQEGFLFAIRCMLEMRFGDEGLLLYPEIEKINDVDLLEAIADAVRVAEDLSEIAALYRRDA